MSAPRIVQSIEITGAGFSLGDLARFTETLGCKLQDQFKQAPFTWVMQWKDHLSVMETQWESEDEKRATIMAIRDTLEAFPEIVAYSVIFEVWMAAYDTGAVRPTARIENDLKNRKNILMLDAYHRDGRRKQKWLECIPDPNGKIFRREFKLDGAMMGAGPMHDLFRPEVPIPEDATRIADA